MTLDSWRTSDLMADGALCMTYIALNVLLNSGNRLALGRCGFAFPALLTSTHMFCNVVFLAPIMLLLPSYRGGSVLRCGKNWKELFVVAVLNVSQLTLNNSSLVHIELCMNQVVRATLPVFVALIQSVRSTPPPLLHMTVLAAISMGAHLVAYQPPTVSGGKFQGVLLVTLSVVLQASQMCFAGSLLSARFDALQVTFYTSQLAALVSAGPAALLEARQFGHFVTTNPWLAFRVLAGTSLLAVAYNVVVFQTIQRLSAVGSAVLGNVKVVVLLLLSSLLMGEMLNWSSSQCLGCMLTFGGAAMYSALKLRTANESSRVGGSWRAWWSGCSKFHAVLASAGFLVIMLFTVFLALGDRAMLRWEKWVGPGEFWEALGDGPWGAGQDPCRHVTIDAGRGWPLPAPSTGELVLVTGGAGFIGSHLVTWLLKLGYSVRVLDNLETGNLLFLELRAPRLEFQHGDILDIRALRAAMVGVRGVFHLGAASKVLPSLRNPQMATFNYERNVLGTARVLEVANETVGVRKVVYAASSTYYGNQEVPFAETDPFVPTSPYAASKYMGELEMLTHDGLYHLPTLSLRFFMVYGPRNPSHGPYAVVTGKFLQRLQENQPLMIEGNGRNFRDFVHVEDVARALILGYQSSIHGTVINVGSGQSHTVKDVADLVSGNQVHVAARLNDLLGTLADTCRAKRLLHFEAYHDFLETMRQMKSDASAGKGEYLAPMWKDLEVMKAIDDHLPGWSNLTSSQERSARIREALKANGSFLAGLLAEIRATPLREHCCGAAA